MDVPDPIIEICTAFCILRFSSSVYLGELLKIVCIFKHSKAISLTISALGVL